ncbi:hypothetical protein JKA74_10525 [Marivirga sp. S37H4]|uniref:Uncharacterized protein n=1 Tax=Marivirga aurantiaca TaxID=2802615 RepID=A0A934WYZ0_9BACT|nr:lipase family protein [Marivirga aurantiaca]MBK6265472.1 hypothetical protein [Marivirga aurantiaca]
MQAKKFLQLLPFLFLSLLWISCSDDNVEPGFDHVLSYELVETISKGEINQRFNNDPLVSGFINFDVEAYKVTYLTPNYDGTEVEASGLVLIPQVEGAVKLTSFQHSTLAKSNDPQIDQEHRAPSYLSSENAEIYLSAVLYASNGYLISSADYIGYGSTSEMFHPYEHAQTAATTCFDMLLATKELAESLSVNMTDELFLIGYSQGGNSTMALHKYIEENHAAEFPITRSAMGAGAYHKSAVGDYIFNFQGDLGFSISLYLWVLDSYDRIYLQKGIPYYLNEPYASEVVDNGYFAISSSNPQEVFTDTFIDDINDPNSDFRDALADNDIHDWKAIAPIKLYHSLEDKLVPYFNSADAFDNMTDKGSTEILLETYTYNSSVEPDAIHGAGGARFFSDVISVYFKYGI